ncbi:MAG: AsmA family protein, partial [Anderseniella sp.]
RICIMKRIIIPILVLVLIATIAIVSIPLLVRGDFATAQLSSAVEQATGRKLTLLKPPEVKLWPSLRLEVEGATLSNPPAMFDGTTISAQALKLQLSWSELLSRQINFQELTLVRPRLNLVVDKQGKANWDFNKDGGVAEPSISGGSPAVESVQLAPIRIEDGEIVYADERSGSSFRATGVNVIVSMANAQAPMDVKGSLIWNGQRIDLQVFAKSPTRLATKGSPIELSIQSANLTAALSGLARFGDGLNLAGNLDVTSPDLRKLAKWAGAEIGGQAGLKQFSAKAGVDLSGQTVKLNKATIAMDGMNAQGNVVLTLSENRPRITASLGLDRLNTNIYTGKQSSSDSGKPQADWNDALIDFSSLNSLDARLRLRTGGIDYGDVKFGETLLDIDMGAGKLNADLKKITLYGSTATGKLSLDGSTRVPRLTGQFDTSGLDALALFKDFAGTSRFEGKLATTLNLAANGRSQRELVSRLSGTAQFRLTDGTIRSIDMAKMVTGVQSAVLGGWDKTDNAGTKFSTLSAGFRFTDGIGNNDDLSLVGPQVRVTGKGTVDLLRKRLNYKVAPSAASGPGGEFTGLVVPVIVKGPWANPKIYPDVQGILENPQAALDALNKLGVSTGNINVEAAGNELKDQAKGKVSKAIEDRARGVVGDEAAKALGEQGTGKAEKLFKNLLNKPQE